MGNRTGGTAQQYYARRLISWCGSGPSTYIKALLSSYKYAFLKCNKRLTFDYDNKIGLSTAPSLPYSASAHSNTSITMEREVRSEESPPDYQFINDTTPRADPYPSAAADVAFILEGLDRIAPTSPPRFSMGAARSARLRRYPTAAGGATADIGDSKKPQQQ